MSESTSEVPPGGRIGVLGGGQLGRMLALAAARLGFQAVMYAPPGDNPAFDVAAERFEAAWDDVEALDRFAARCDVVTLEFENVPVAAVERVARQTPVRPGATALARAQDRLVEKDFLRALDVETAPYRAVDDRAQLAQAVRAMPGRSLLKTRRAGYDGKGQVWISAMAALGADVDATLDQAWTALAGAPAILEGEAPFLREISVIVARGVDGAARCYDPAENEHKGGVLRASRVPTAASPETCAAAQAIAARIVDALDYVGVMGVEFFELEGGRLLVNEMAPRVHNSGHWSLEACAVSQFEQHIRAVCAWPLGDPARHSDAEMRNLLGEDAMRWSAIAREDGASLHLYGKDVAAAGRKMGHVTRLLGPARRS